MDQIKTKKILMAIVGIILTGVSVAIFKTANLGTDPFSSFSLGICNVTGLDYSIIYVVVNTVLLIGIFVIDKHYIGLSTVLNLAFIGIIVEKCMAVFEKWFPADHLVQKIVLLCIAVILMCFAASLYFTADMGVSTYDAWALILSGKKQVPFKICRIGTDTLCTAAGFAMGAVVGIGTVITAFGMGPFIEFFNRTCARPFLYGKADGESGARG